MSAFISALKKMICKRVNYVCKMESTRRILQMTREFAREHIRQ